MTVVPQGERLRAFRAIAQARLRRWPGLADAASDAGFVALPPAAKMQRLMAEGGPWSSYRFGDLDRPERAMILREIAESAFFADGW